MDRKINKVKEMKWRVIVDPGNALMLIYLFAVVVFLVVGSVVGSDAAEVAPASEQEHESSGGLLAIMDDGKMRPAPLLSQKIEMQVSGIVNRVKVVQRFINNTPGWIEAVYVFPLPDESGVDHMRLRIGERIIEGKIMEKAEAQKVHEKAKQQGKKSSLLKQNRPNIFTTRVANIGPGEEVEVEIEYQQLVSYRDGVFSLRFPMVVGPRYIPGRPIQERINIEAGGWAAATDQVPDAPEITPPVALHKETFIPVELRVDLVSGLALSRIDSLYHPITSEKISKGHYEVLLSDPDVPADRDFVLEWEPEKSPRTQAALFSESISNEQYLLLLVVPPYEVVEQAVVPREVVFILDISGSMAGASIKQAKKSIALALDALRVTDSFNVIVFNNQAYTLFNEAKLATENNLRTAHEYIEGLKADGGTEMMSALKLALDGSFRHERLRQVIFMTDGAVGNEDELFKLISRRLGDSRLFTVGIGSAPNGYFMTRAAQMGKGSYVYIGDQSEVMEKMGQLLKKISSPVISDLTLSLGGESDEKDMEVYPSPIPDLYHGEPVIVALRTGWINSALKLSGQKADTVWQTIIDTSTYGVREGIAGLWARKKIRDQMESLALGGDEAEVRQTVVDTALKHHLVSRYTSLVGVDNQISRPEKQDQKQAAVKTHLPHGWQASALFAGGAQTATPAGLRIVLGFCFLITAAIVFLVSRRYARV